MKKIYILFSLLVCFVANAQIVNIPDANFKAKLLSASPSNGIAKNSYDQWVKIDTNNDGEIQIAEASSIEYLNVNNSNINDLTGINYFNNLKTLSFFLNSISNSLDLSSLTNLQVINCSYNDITNLNLSNLINLKEIYCNNNSLTELNILNTASLEKINCSINYLISIDFSQSPLLLEIDCSSNNYLSTINTTQNINLRKLYCGGQQLTNLNLTQNIALYYFLCGNSNISTLDVTQNTELRTLDCFNTNLSTLDVTQNTQLIKLNCATNNLTNLDISMNLNLEHLNCSNNNLSNLNVSQNTNLTHLYFNNIQISQIDLSSQNSTLIELSCSNNPLNTLDVSQKPNLTRLYCENTNISSLDISQNTQLEILNCSNNNLSILNISQNQEIKSLRCNSNNLIDLNLNTLPNLEWLDCSNNLLNNLDVSLNEKITYLKCSGNQLELLNIKCDNVYWKQNAFASNGSGLIFDNNPDLFYICADENDISIVEQKLNEYGIISTCHVNSYCSFIPGGTIYVVQGNIYFDIDNNGCDTTDPSLPNMRANIVSGVSNSTLITSNQLSSYYIPVGAGNHTITYDFFDSNYFTFYPASITVDFPTQASPFTQDICATPNGQHHDVEVSILPLNTARPGFDANYKIVYKNIGNQAETGNVTLTFQDNVLDYVSSTPVYNSTGSNTLTWDFTNLLPFETREILVTFNVNNPTETPPINNGDILNYTANITINNTDEDLSNNVSDLAQTVLGSYDPNDKTCLEGETVAPTMIGEYVHYMIRFENTGTYPAQNIVVKDMIDETKFDVSTLIPISGSHEFYTRINGNKVEFIFENINLPFDDAINDGYVAFKIKTLPSLVVGDTFSNEANIYFDYNFPITTNNFTTTVQQPLYSEDFTFENEFVLYPNPVKNELNISAKNQTEIQSLEIYNVLGQVVLAVSNPSNAIDVSNLKTGNYFVKVNTKTGSTTTKFVKE